MRTETITRTLYKFHELSEESKAMALDSLRDTNIDYEWWDSCYCILREDLREIGIEVDEKHPFFFDNGEFTLNKPRIDDAGKVINKLLPDLAPRYRAILEDQIRLDTYRSHASFVLGYFYMGERCRRLAKVLEDALETLNQGLEGWCHDALRMLDDEYMYLSSDEATTETIECHDYEFTESGELA